VDLVSGLIEYLSAKVQVVAPVKHMLMKVSTSEAARRSTAACRRVPDWSLCGAAAPAFLGIRGVGYRTVTASKIVSVHLGVQ